jgi:LysR family transcriptional regulator, glycine cleavage system transcriptional activator
MTNTPAFQTLRAFEAAARLRSYSRAAEELHVTHGAISHRIRDLETRQGVQLFDRVGHRMMPTADAQKLLVQVRQILGLLDATFAAKPTLRHGLGESRQTLVLSVLPAFASHWLLKRLPDFQRLHPDIEIDLRVTSDLVDLNTSGIDAAIRYGPGNWADVATTKLGDEHLFPVCSPALAARHSFRTVGDLASAPLLRSAWQPWTPWFQAVGITDAEPQSGASFSDVGLMLQSAVAGNGVALGRALLVGDLVDAGTLVQLSEITVPDIYGYYLVSSAKRSASKALQNFENWLKTSIEPRTVAISERREGFGGR